MEEKMRCFKRKIYDTMLDWKNSRHGDTALLIQGHVVLVSQPLPKNLPAMNINPIS